MTFKISVSNQKGGTGKSTVCSTLAAYLASAGRTVLMVDMDPQGHLSTLTGTVHKDGVFDLLVNGRDLYDVIIPIDQALHGGSGWLGLLPGHTRTQLAAVDMQLRGHDYRLLQRSLEPLEAKFDYILFDNSPTVSLFTPSILAATDYVLIPTRMASLDIQGVSEVITIMTNLAGGHDAQLLGIVPTQCTPNTLEYREQIGAMKAMYGEYVWDDAQTTLSTVWAEASSVATPIFRYQPDHKASEQAATLGNKVMQILEGEYV